MTIAAIRTRQSANDRFSFSGFVWLFEWPTKSERYSRIVKKVYLLEYEFNNIRDNIKTDNDHWQ